MSTEAKETPTPETNGSLLRYYHDNSLVRFSGGHIVEADFARTLERQRDAALAENAKLREDIKELCEAQDNFDTVCGKRESELMNGFVGGKTSIDLRGARLRLALARDEATKAIRKDGRDE